MGESEIFGGLFNKAKTAGVDPKVGSFRDEPMAPAPVVVNINGAGLQTLVDTITVEQNRNSNLRRVQRV